MTVNLKYIFDKPITYAYNIIMTNFFKRKQKIKESNIAETPKSDPAKPKVSKRDIIFLIINILSIVLYSCYSLFVTYRMTDEKSFLGRFIIVALIVYAVAFILLILLSITNRKKLKHRLKNYKSAIKFLKYIVQIINFVLSIVTTISALVNNEKVDFSVIGFAILSFIITVILILVEIASIIVRKNIPLIKRNFLEIREPEKFNNKNNDELNKNSNTNKDKK